MIFSPIKWAGSKRLHAQKIIEHFPKKINTYWELFLGSGSVMLHLLKREDIEVKSFIGSDFYYSLINLWKTIKESPELLIEDYKVMQLR